MSLCRRCSEIAVSLPQDCDYISCPWEARSKLERERDDLAAQLAAAVEALKAIDRQNDGTLAQQQAQEALDALEETT